MKNKMEKRITKYRNDTTRLKNRDYGAPGNYFITICTQNRENYFGHVKWVAPVGTQNFVFLQTARVQLTPIGKISHQYWIEIPSHFPFVVLDEFIIMPNHVHGILVINKPNYQDLKPNTFGPQSQNLASTIRGYKAATKKYATVNGLEFSWQPRYHDRILRLDELDTCRKYIQNNATKWMTHADKII
jgi:putative transposase